ncbi:Bug family tripartite tricarboxylate transporter substrate binding protein [Pigmentiphaga kullae]|uniref:Tripartite-type tricarboxylate transporter receptor subunit TctC n=1 Tax=Pigmentiphaga kullae TaxID=151784 RepID=A0A4Q7NDZ4_9BURK|nr:tripartite tricarboxylate transporter substrate binding protein [Pigmentiphaga kullae]RZS81312.1 tripartite-type tricarboxylate transporter receptor subunit TctC [Pigmentiphaga kullae]
MNRLLRCVLGVGVVAVLGAASSARAQDEAFPSRPIRLLVGFAPGGGTDVVARVIAPRLSEILGQSVVVENKPGASGIVAGGMVAKAPPDGYTLMMGVVSVNTILPHLFNNIPYDTATDFAPVTLTASVPHFIAVHPSVPVHSVAELIAYAKAHPGQLSFPSAGSGTTPHIAGEMFKSMAGVQLLHVPYKSTGQSMPDLLAGRLQVGFDTYPTTAPYVKTGKLRALAVTGARRLAEFPDLPTVAESGLPDYRFATWYGVFAPRGTPAAIVNRLHDGIAKAMAAPDVREQLLKMGVDGTETRTPEEFASLVRADAERFGKLVKAAGVRVD